MAALIIDLTIFTMFKNEKSILEVEIKILKIHHVLMIGMAEYIAGFSLTRGFVTMLLILLRQIIFILYDFDTT